ncbi:hypothetical protein [Virgibacillus halodenitrificans]|uniref:hypothetical protein n=1 Tax=Virgibacillus halodenitrificans TaxID=1482 RepID=UPI000EF5153B|nr:hypothetical protein [Virgibacillus halodenitrificans]
MNVIMNTFGLTEDSSELQKFFIPRLVLISNSAERILQTKGDFTTEESKRNTALGFLTMSATVEALSEFLKVEKQDWPKLAAIANDKHMKWLIKNTNKLINDIEDSPNNQALYKAGSSETYVPEDIMATVNVIQTYADELRDVLLNEN